MNLHHLDEGHIALFLSQVFILLLSAKALGFLFHRKGLPSLAGEILAGILLGPTLFGRLLPDMQTRIFPNDPLQIAMLDTVAWVGVLFLLLSTGFDLSLSTVWKQGRAAVLIGIVGVLIPLLIGVLAFFGVPENLWGESASRLTFTLFLAAAAAITSISIMSKVLYDLEILKSDMGSISLSACAVNDVTGWIFFAVILALVTQTSIQLSNLGRILFDILMFGTICLTLGSRIVGWITDRLNRACLPQPATMLTLIALIGVLCGAITHWIGIHAILGFFLAGVMIGNTTAISEHTREMLSQTIHAIFVPLFFASIGLKVDFISGSHLPILLLFTAVAMGGKFAGAWAGARMAALSKPDALSVGIAFTPGGAMEIIMGMLALELKLISPSVFVAIVFAALLSSIAVGPLLAWSLRRRKAINLGGLFARDAVTLRLAGATRWDAIAELCRRAAAHIPGADARALEDAVRRREEIMGTGLERGVAVPHARLPQLTSPLVAFGLSKPGINWDARDGLATHFVFLVLTPEYEEGAQVQIVAAIAREMMRAELPGKLMTAESEDQLFRLLNETLALKTRPSPAG